MSDRWRGASARGLWGAGLSLLVASCGGHTSHGGVSEAGAEGGIGGTTNAGGSMATGGSAAAELRGCPDASWGRCESRTLLTVRTDGRSEGEGRIWAEPLQVDRPPPRPIMTPSTEPGPEAWDRSERPAGACVFRIHGAPASCFAGRAHMTFLPCDPSDRQRPIHLSYYELASCEQGIAPGCPSPNAPWGSQNYAWYATREDEATVTVVMCAGLCETMVQSGAACFLLAPTVGPG